MPDSDIAIRVQNLSKRYRIGLQEDRHDTFAATLAEMVKRPGKNLQRLRRLTRFGDNDQDASDIIWALRDVSFEVKRGEVLGIIGRNGAGKSTLLKILSRITHPTSGRVELRGRVSSLLEVGTGFHPELTGRENVYLNGTILGMRKKEIDRKFDEIVDFSGVEKFIDTPVKRYSSGMRVRLAFSVAAFLEPEILLIDEVLAVGDAEFQKRCLGKMGDVAKLGRTVLFVSHNMPSVSSLCDTTMWLETGQIIDAGKTDTLVAHYISSGKNESAVSLRNRTDRRGTGEIKFLELSILDVSGKATDSIVYGQEVIFALRYATNGNKYLRNAIVSIEIHDLYDSKLFTLSTHFVVDGLDLLPPRGILLCRVPTIPLVAGLYSIYLWSSVKRVAADIIRQAAEFTVVESDVYGSGKVPIRRKHGSFIISQNWSVRQD